MHTIEELTQENVKAFTKGKSIAPLENGTTASKAYAIGEQFIRNGVLYKAKTAIASGATLTLNTNYELADKVATQIASLKETLTNQINNNGTKNLLPFTENNIKIGRSWNGNSIVINGITFTIIKDANGNIADLTATGTVTGGNFNLFPIITFTLPKGKYILNGITGGSTVSFYQQMFGDVDYTSGQGILNTNGETTFTLTTTNTLTYNLYFRNGGVLNNVSIKPMIRLATDENGTYEPYAKTNQQLTKDDIGLTENEFVNGAVNLLENKATNATSFDVAFVVNSDKTVTANGTSTHSDGNKKSSFIINSNVDSSLLNKQFRLSGCPSGGSGNTYFLSGWFYDSNNTLIGDPVIDYGDGVFFVMPSNTAKIEVQVRTNYNYTVSNVVFKPMITVADMPNSDYAHYVPYAKSNKELTDEQFLNGTLGAIATSNFTDTAEYIIPSDGWYFLYLQTNVATSSSFLRIMLGSNYSGNMIAQHGNSNRQYESAYANLPLKKGAKVVFKCTDTSVSCQYQVVPIT